jgi:hypothetical protein
MVAVQNLKGEKYKPTNILNGNYKVSFSKDERI